MKGTNMPSYPGYLLSKPEINGKLDCQRRAAAKRRLCQGSVLRVTRILPANVLLKDAGFFFF